MTRASSHQPEHDDDRMYLDLKGALERLCRAQAFVPSHWRSDVQTAIDIVKLVGSSVCPDAWSEHDQPEYPGPGQ